MKLSTETRKLNGKQYWPMKSFFFVSIFDSTEYKIEQINWSHDKGIQINKFNRNYLFRTSAGSDTFRTENSAEK